MRLRIGQWSPQLTVRHAEYRRERSGPEAERENRRQRERRLAAKSADAEAQMLLNAVDPAHEPGGAVVLAPEPHIARVFTREYCIAHAPAALGGRLGRR